MKTRHEMSQSSGATKAACSSSMSKTAATRISSHSLQPCPLSTLWTSSVFYQSLAEGWADICRLGTGNHSMHSCRVIQIICLPSLHYMRTPFRTTPNRRPKGLLQLTRHEEKLWSWPFIHSRRTSVRGNPALYEIVLIAQSVLDPRFINAWSFASGAFSDESRVFKRHCIP